MSDQAPQRRLAAIFVADVVGYSRLLGAAEEGMLSQLNSHRRELFDRKIAEHYGRIVKTTGDGLLAEFASVVDALRCAIEVQRSTAELVYAIDPRLRLSNLSEMISYLRAGEFAVWEKGLRKAGLPE